MMTKKVLLIYPPIINQVDNIRISAFDKSTGSYPPLGLLYVATYMRKYTDYDVEILDCFVNRMTFDEIKTKIKGIRPDLVGISVMTHLWLDALELAKIAKDLSPAIKTVVGGPHATIYPVSSLKNNYIDYAICGEGEESLTKLVSAIFSGQSEEDISKIPGVASKLHLESHKTNNDIKAQKIADLDEIPFPDRTIIDNSEYFSIFAQKGTFTTLMSSRGCPFKCIYCGERLGKNFRAVSAEKLIEEIKESIKLGVKNFFLHDDTFTVDKKRVKQICETLLKENLNITWEARSRVDCVDYELLKLMKQAGLSRISFGVESGNDKVLEKLRKGITLETVKKVFKWCKEFNIITFADFMIGSPGEGLKEIEDSIKFIKKIKPDYVQFSITCPYPATPLYEELVKAGKIKSDVWLEFVEHPSADFSPPIASEFFDRNELEKLTAKAYKEVYFSLPFLFKELKKIKSLDMLTTRVKSTLSLVKS